MNANFGFFNWFSRILVLSFWSDRIDLNFLDFNFIILFYHSNRNRINLIIFKLNFDHHCLMFFCAWIHFDFGMSLVRGICLHLQKKTLKCDDIYQNKKKKEKRNIVVTVVVFVFSTLIYRMSEFFFFGFICLFVIIIILFYHFCNRYLVTIRCRKNARKIHND